MKFSEQWLREWVDTPLSTEELCHKLTVAGLEVDSIEAVAPKFSNVIVAEVVKAAKHPNADKLSLCEINTGKGEHIPVVCGGPNVRSGMKVALAQIGAVLPGDFKIKKSKIRGEVSEGMLCGAEELGIGESHNKFIMDLPEDAPVGTDLREYLSLDDNSIDIELTPNRGDCLGILGLAREVAAIAASSLTFSSNDNEKKIEKGSSVGSSKPSGDSRFRGNDDGSDSRFRGNDEEKKITLSAKQACPHYVGRIIKGINATATTPIWMQERLRRSGLRTIHPIVDITNYVMLELGQPLHAFDLTTITGDINVRMAVDNEEITLLDGTELLLSAKDLVIADEKSPLALAGVMGGLDSSVTLETRDLFLESAYFDPVLINKTSQRHKIYSDSAYRFARGVDFSLQKQAIERMTQLILEIAGGEAGPITEAIDEKSLPVLPEIKLRLSRISRILGVDVPEDSVESYLIALGMTIKKNDEGFLVKPPAHRFDIRTEIDLIEEVGRLYGFDNVPTTKPTGILQSLAQPIHKLSLNRIRELLVNHGYHEVLTYSFIDPKLAEALSLSKEFRRLKNPISSDLSVMRENHWPGLIQTYLYNQARQESRQRLFETGLCFKQESGELLQKPRIGGLISGQLFPESWATAEQNLDFFDLKGDIEALLDLSFKNEQVTFNPTEHPALHPGQSAEIKIDGQNVGYLGKLHPQWRQKFSIKSDLYLFDLDLDIIINTLLPSYQAVSKYPATRRDISLVVGQDVAVANLLVDIKKQGGNALTSTEIFDVYSGEGVPSGQKSIAIGLTFNDPSRTLVDEEVNALMEKIITSLETQFNATLRV